MNLEKYKKYDSNFTVLVNQGLKDIKNDNVFIFYAGLCLKYAWTKELDKLEYTIHQLMQYNTISSPLDFMVTEDMELLCKIKEQDLDHYELIYDVINLIKYPNREKYHNIQKRFE